MIPTGDEIRATGVPLIAGEVRDTNSVMLAGLLEQLGARPLLCPVVPDEPALLRTGGPGCRRTRRYDPAHRGHQRRPRRSCSRRPHNVWAAWHSASSQYGPDTLRWPGLSTVTDQYR
ncbi:hypothetical protein [Mycobacterium sp. 852013-50091_SCH5140682]|uniref:hypothetical protein n=1 Tax=Mycobacterium sp. 852013-50091_SCH5140682 TaxID=1834109 RepID=UPI00336C2DCC